MKGREPSVEPIKYLVKSLRKIKLIKGKHTPKVDSWHTTLRKVSDKINHKMTKSVFKNTPRGSRLKRNNEENSLRKKVSSNKKFHTGKNYPQLHGWLDGGKELLDQPNLKAVPSLHRRPLENQSLQIKPFHSFPDINPSSLLSKKQRNKKEYKNFLCNDLLGRSMKKNVTNYSGFPETIQHTEELWIKIHSLQQRFERAFYKEWSCLFGLERCRPNQIVSRTSNYSIFQRKIRGQGSENKIIVKFTNLLMVDGKKSKALSTLSKSLKFFKKNVKDLSCHDQFLQNSPNSKNKNSMLNYLDQAVTNVKPCLEVRKKKISGIMRQIPAVPSSKRQETLGIRWIIESARRRRKKNYKPFFQCLAEELLDAFQNQGEPYKRKQALHRTAEANRIYIRHRWW